MCQTPHRGRKDAYQSAKSTIMSDPKVWLITGSSSGFGRELTEFVLKNGDIAVATLRKPEALADLSSTYPLSQLLVLKLDVTNPSEIVSAFAEAEEKFGRIDVVFNNAGYGVLAEVEGTPEEVARGMFEVNFWGAAAVSREAVRFFRDVNKPAGGRLLQMSSLSGIEAQPTLGYYAATKFALEGLSEAIAAEVDPAWNIKVTIIEPGGFRTKITSSSMQLIPAHPAYNNPDTQVVMFRQYLESNPVMPGDASKAAGVFHRLASYPDPPLRFPLGKDCISGVRRKTAKLLQDVDNFESWSEGTEARD